MALENCPKCGSNEFGIIRDMTSRRVCKCGETWPCPSKKTSIAEKINSREFYELMLLYRHTPVEDLVAVAEAYATVKKFLETEE